ncbi:MAG TPA: hypothetical protein VFO74_13840, partial [Pseudolabrys sp.]|nr:hypothetical protein [Pseudolabrys sp.]
KRLREQRVLQGETTLYITPRLLHIKMWAEWFQNYGAGFDVGAFEEQLPTTQLIDWFREMYQFARESKESMAVVKKLLDETGPFASASFFEHRRSAEFFLRLTDAAPDAALRRLEQTIGKWDRDRLKDFGEGRRQVVWALERIAVWRDLFAGAARILLKLAEAENENIGNNATGVFADLFSPGDGPVAPTEASPEERFPILQEAFRSTSADRRKVALLAADHALETGHFSRAVGAEYQGLRHPPKLWVPETWGELFDAYRRVWHLVESSLDTLPEDERQEALKVLLKQARGVSGMANLSSMVVDTLTSLVSKEWIDRTDIIDTVEDIYRYGIEQMDPSVKTLWDRLRTLLAPSDFPSRLERYVAMNRWADLVDDSESDAVGTTIDALAHEAFANPEVLRPALPWLVTDRAKNGYRFGYELGRSDTNCALLPELVGAQRLAEKPNAFFLGGYLRAVAARNIEVFESVLDALAQDEQLRVLVPELSFRAQFTDRGARRLISMLQSSAIEPWRLGILSFGGTVRNLSESTFFELIEQLIALDSGVAAGTALDLFQFYFFHRDSHPPLPRDLTLRLLTANAFFGSSKETRRQLQDYGWNEVAEKFVDAYPEEALPLGKKLLAHFGEEHTVISGFRPQSLKVLDRILHDHPRELWCDIEQYLGPPIDQRGFRIRHWLRDGAMNVIPADVVWKWIDANPELRGWYAANLVAPSFPGDANSISARELLVRYGERDDVRNNLCANFSSEIWWGPESKHWESKIAWIRDLLKAEKHPNVRQWLTEFEFILSSRLERAKVEEEREKY